MAGKAGWVGLVVLGVVLSVAMPVTAGAQEVTIAAASDLNFALKDMIAEFERKTGASVKLSLGSSGNFFSQIQHGAPFDLFFSADIRYPQKLEQTGHAVSGSLYRYAVGRLVLWVPAGSSLNPEKLGMDVFREASIRKIAVANPRHAPYGRAAIAALEQFKVYGLVKDKLVFGENIAQTAQFVESGAADIGLIALSLALAPPMKEAGRHWEVPPDSYPSLEQGVVIVNGGKNPKGAKAFLDFLRGPEGQAVMQRYGFILPTEAGRS